MNNHIPVPAHDFTPVGGRVIQKLPASFMAALDELFLDGDGRMRVLEAEMLRSFPHFALQNWAQARGRYQFPTAELIQWLRARIAGRQCVEIGAGYGDIGRNVGGVTLTDSYFQTSEAMRLLYGAMVTHPIVPPADVMKREATAAAMKYNPDVMLACWVTQCYQPGDEGSETTPKIGSCVGGVDFAGLLPYVGELIFVGNAETHKSMRLLALPHEEYSFPWIVSKAHDQGLNRIWVWKGGKAGA